jgi:GT2 family glycosyltransferase
MRRPPVRRVWRRLSATASANPTLRVDSGWILADGSLAIDGWCALLPELSGPLEVRARGGPDDWQPLVRKHRADVATHLLGWSDPIRGAADYGFVGHVQTSGPATSRVVLDFRSAAHTWTLEVGDLHREGPPEDVFAGISVSDLTPSGVEPLALMVAHATRPQHPHVVTAYKYSSDVGTPRINVVVPVFGQFDFLRNLLLALASPHERDIVVTVVCDDPGLAPRLVDWTLRWNDLVYRVPLQVLVQDRNAGFASACNTGWAASTEPYQLLLNSDVLINYPRTDLQRLAGLLDKQVSAVAPVLLFPDGRLQHAGMELQEHPDFPGFVLPQHPGKGDNPRDLPSAPFTASLLTGAAIMTTREALEAVGGVPVVFGRGDFEDVLLCSALAERGRLLVDPTVRWTHVEGASYDRDRVGGVPLTLAKSKVALSKFAAAR